MSDDEEVRAQRQNVMIRTMRLARAIANRLKVDVTDVYVQMLMLCAGAVASRRGDKAVRLIVNAALKVQHKNAETREGPLG